MYILYINCIYAVIPDYMLYLGMYMCLTHAYFLVGACIHLTHFCYAILVYTIKMPYQYRSKLTYLLKD